MTDNKPTDVLLAERLLSLLADEGFSPEQLYSQVASPTLPESQRAEQAFNASDLPELLQAAVNLSNNPGLMLKLGQRLDIASLGTFGFALMSCASLKDALQLLVRYLPITGSGIYFQMHTYPNEVALEIRLELGNPSQQQLVTELAFAQIYSAGEFLINQPLATGSVQFGYPPPVHRSAYNAVFTVPIEFGHSRSQFVIPNELLSTKVSSANPAGHVIFQQQCEDMLRRLNRVENFSATVRRQLIRAGGALPDVKQVAAQIYVSERTLKRRLMNEATSFRAICNEVKNVLACQYLTSTALTIAEIANLLNYSETVSFRRAFVRWNGIAPNAYRQQSNKGESR
ncbi:MAG: AraC family transcriptional regulator [Pseudomonadales bacterium]